MTQVEKIFKISTPVTHSFSSPSRQSAEAVDDYSVKKAIYTQELYANTISGDIDAKSIQGVDITSVAPTDGKILVFRTSDDKWILEDKPDSGGGGLSGYSGYSGYSGLSGYSGVGVSGYSGQDGVIGQDGASGYSGTSGYSGESGFSGWSGISGYSGSGISGFSGISGWSGSGISGYSGSGISGYSGYSGISGYSGTISTTLPSGCEAVDHGTASTDMVINVCYGTSATPPTASNTTEGTLYIKYTA